MRKPTRLPHMTRICITIDKLGIATLSQDGIQIPVKHPGISPAKINALTADVGLLDAGSGKMQRVRDVGTRDAVNKDIMTEAHARFDAAERAVLILDDGRTNTRCTMKVK